MANVTIINDERECSVISFPLPPTHSSPARIHCCIHSLLGLRAVNTTFTFASWFSAQVYLWLSCMQ